MNIIVLQSSGNCIDIGLGVWYQQEEVSSFFLQIPALIVIMCIFTSPFFLLANCQSDLPSESCCSCPLRASVFVIIIQYIYSWNKFIHQWHINVKKSKPIVLKCKGVMIHWDTLLISMNYWVSSAVQLKFRDGLMVPPGAVSHVEVCSASWPSSNIVSAVRTELPVPGCGRVSGRQLTICDCECMMYMESKTWKKILCLFLRKWKRTTKW